MNCQKINELIDLLEREAGIYDDLLKLSQNKTEVIIKGKVSELDNITKLEQSLILNMGKLEALREKVVSELSEEINVDQAKITISEIVKYIDDTQAERLEAYKTNLLNTIKEIKGINELNSNLIKNSIEYIDFSLNILSNIPAADNNYGNSGLTNEVRKKTYFDVKL